LDLHPFLLNNNNEKKRVSPERKQNKSLQEIQINFGRNRKSLLAYFFVSKTKPT